MEWSIVFAEHLGLSPPHHLVIIEDKYLSFTTTPTANTLRVLVSILDEKKAFEVIDSYIKEAR